ncbi:MAG: peptidyl-prolyl cis-trans isomerase [Candidatus Omnitrophica bacterium]|nr:peptidyl-prolyl cis-trans isomerase [Candidatus Omnitrophota bacterium]
MRKYTVLACGLFLCLALFGCDKLFPKSQGGAGLGRTSPAISTKGTVIAKINNMPITLEDLNEEVNAFNEAVGQNRPEAKITTKEQKVTYLKNELVRRMLLYQDALNKGLDRNEDVVKVMDKTKMDLLVVELVRQEAQKIDVSSKEIEDYYNTYKEQLKEPEERQLREIMLSTEQEAKDVMVQLLQGADFATVAKASSKAPSAKDGGDLGFITKGKKSPQFDAAAFSDTLEVGKMSGVFKGPDGYYIVKLEAKRGGKQRSLSDMWDDIKKGLTFLKQQQKIEDLIGKLSRESKIEINEGEIK